MVGLLVAVLGGSWPLAGVLGAYLLITTAYTIRLKREPVADVFVLAGLYVLRIVAGGVAAGITLSTWLLAMALFVFLSLAFVKRYTELVAQSEQEAIPGRGYRAADIPWMHAIGTNAGYMAVLVLTLYVTAPDVAVMYTRPQVLWLLSPVLLFWLMRFWLLAGRRAVHDDPVVEALRDPLSYCCLAALGTILVAAI
jgi:4-hydroxybenzoate polyprenyltransferase